MIFLPQHEHGDSDGRFHYSGLGTIIQTRNTINVFVSRRAKHGEDIRILSIILYFLQLSLKSARLNISITGGGIRKNKNKYNERVKSKLYDVEGLNYIMYKTRAKLIVSHWKLDDIKGGCHLEMILMVVRVDRNRSPNSGD